MLTNLGFKSLKIPVVKWRVIHLLLDEVFPSFVIVNNSEWCVYSSMDISYLNEKESQLLLIYHWMNNCLKICSLKNSACSHMITSLHTFSNFIISPCYSTKPMHSNANDIVRIILRQHVLTVACTVRTDSRWCCQLMCRKKKKKKTFHQKYYIDHVNTDARPLSVVFTFFRKKNLSNFSPELLE